MIKEKDLYWLAGIIDGEGCLSVNKRQGILNKNSNNGLGIRSYNVRIDIGNTDMEIIKRSSEIYCELGIKFWYSFIQPDKRFNGRAKGYVHIIVEGYRSCKKLLEAIGDKLQSGQKRRKAELMKEYIEYRLFYFKKPGKSMTVRSERDDNFYNEMISLTKYQVPPSTTRRKASTVLQW